MSCGTYPGRNSYYFERSDNVIKRCKRQSWATNRFSSFRKSWIGLFVDKLSVSFENFWYLLNYKVMVFKYLNIFY